MFSLQNAWPIKRKAVYTLVLFHTYFLCENRIGSQLTYFLKQFFKLFLVNLQAVAAVRSVASGGEFCRLPPNKENTAIPFSFCA